MNFEGVDTVEYFRGKKKKFRECIELNLEGMYILSMSYDTSSQMSRLTGTLKSAPLRRKAFFSSASLYLRNV